MNRPTLAMLTVAVLAGCSGSPPPPPPSEDPALLQAQRLGRLAYEQERPDQAATLYRQALDRAYRRDDLPAIGDTGYNLAIVELNRGLPAAALDVARSTRDELARRGAAIPADLQLVEAVALWRTGDGPAAADLAATVAGLADASAATVARAIFLSGLVADDRGDAAGLAAALAALDQGANAATAADRDELAGRLALRQDDAAAAEAAFVRAADRRRQLRDDRGMARALALAGEAAAAGGETAPAADFYLRAGRSAALAGDPGAANRWLLLARDLALQSAVPAIAGEAQSRLDSLDAAATR